MTEQIEKMRANVLVVDDNEDNRIVLARRLERQGHHVASAENGRLAIEQLEADEFDLILLDIMMPEMNGYQVLEYLKASSELRHVPVIVISAVDELDSVIRCIELGAEDYLTKPFNRIMLRARIGATLEKKRLRDQEKAFTELLKNEREKSERLLLSIFPASIAERLKQGPRTIAESFSEVSVLFADIVDFTRYTANLEPNRIVELLSSIFNRFDLLTTKYGLEKIKTIGDAYMVVGGLPSVQDSHLHAVVLLAFEMLKAIGEFANFDDEPFTMRVGIHTGPVVAGVIGTKKFIYDLWGDTVNVASRMESHGTPGKIQTTSEVYQRLKNAFYFEPRGKIEVKGKGLMETYFIIGPK
jgi:class 3 adenylate cyclase